MSVFKSRNAVTIGDNDLGVSNFPTVSIMCIDSAGTVGVTDAGVFYPHAEGELAAGEMLTFEIGKGRGIGFNATTAGTLTITAV